MPSVLIRPLTRQHGSIAQSVEQRIENPRVGSSILPRATKSIFKMCQTALGLDSSVGRAAD